MIATADGSRKARGGWAGHAMWAKSAQRQHMPKLCLRLSWLSALRNLIQVNETSAYFQFFPAFHFLFAVKEDRRSHSSACHPHQVQPAAVRFSPADDKGAGGGEEGTWSLAVLVHSPTKQCRGEKRDGFSKWAHTQRERRRPTAEPLCPSRPEVKVRGHSLHSRHANR